MSVNVLAGDCTVILPTLDADSFDSCVCDPPYHLVSIHKRFAKTSGADRQPGTEAFGRLSKGFMGKTWDGGDVAFRAETWAEVLRVLKPGAHLIAFGGTRTYHRLACAIEDAGFEIRDQIGWLFGSGFCKSHNLKRNPICDCNDGGNTLPSRHGNQTSEHDLRPLQEAYLSSAEHAPCQRREVLQSHLPEQGSTALRPALPQSETGGSKQSRVEGGQLHRAGQGLSDDTQARSSEGASERLRAGTHSGGRREAGQAAEAGRGSASREPDQSGQFAGQSNGLRNASGTLDDGALSGRGACARCGKIRQEFEGFGSALKPAWEPIVLARKPLGESTIAGNVLQHGTGAINIDGCRVHGEDAQGGSYTVKRLKPGATLDKTGGNWRPEDGPEFHGEMKPGRWPANVIHDGSDEVVSAFPDSAGQQGDVTGREPSVPLGGHVYGGGMSRHGHAAAARNDSGSAARFFYSSKADALDRLGSKHPTVKPVDLMRYLCRLVTPPGGHVLDCFAGSGTTGMAAMAEGFNATLIEREAEYVADIKRRVAHVDGGDTPLFAPVETV